MARRIIRDAKVVTDKVTRASIMIEDSIITGIEEGNFQPRDDDQVIEANGLYAAPGFIELHSHGAGGADFMDGTIEAYDTACDMHLKHGVTTILPTTVAASVDEYLATIEAIKKAKGLRASKQNLQGLHFEGPFFPMQRAGGMDERYICDPSPELYERLIDAADGVIARWTAAPELKGAEQFGDYCTKHGILVSIGHTNATIRDVRRAKEHGFRHVTHMYSDMSTITRESGFRVLGVLECCYTMKDLWIEVISDGCHLPPDLFRMIFDLIGPERLQLCSDSIRPAGTDAKEVIVGSLGNGIKGIVEDGVAKMLDRTAFLGSIALGNELVKRTMNGAGIQITDAIRMMSTNPARILGLENKGEIKVGKDADIVLLDESIDVAKVLYRGSVVA